MRKTLIAASVAAALALPLASHAQTAAAPAAAPASPHTFTGNVGVFSQYIFRGLTQTNRKPALQGGFDYTHSSGFYAGLWGSNVSWFEETNVGSIAAPIKLSQPGGAGGAFTANAANSNSLEIDIYGGYKWNMGDFGFDIGLLQYWYPGTYNNLGGYFAKPDTLEGYGSVSWKWFTAKYSQSTGDAFGVKNSKGSSYIDLSANIPLWESGFTLGLHMGRQKFKGVSPVWAFSFPGGNAPDNDKLFYTDYKVSLSKEWLGLNWQAFYTRTNASARATGGRPVVTGAVWDNVYGKNIGDSTLTIGVSKTF